MERGSESGQGLVEYGLVIGLVSIAAVGSIFALGGGVLSMYLSNLASLYAAM